MRRAAVVVGLALLVGAVSCRPPRLRELVWCETDAECPKRTRCYEHLGGEPVDRDGNFYPEGSARTPLVSSGART